MACCRGSTQEAALFAPSNENVTIGVSFRENADHRHGGLLFEKHTHGLELRFKLAFHLPFVDIDPMPPVTAMQMEESPKVTLTRASSVSEASSWLGRVFNTKGPPRNQDVGQQRAA